MTLLQQLTRQRFEERERLRHEVRHRLREFLSRTIPGRGVFVFGSLIQAGKFTEVSDIDLALESELPGITIYLPTHQCAERANGTQRGRVASR